MKRGLLKATAVALAALCAGLPIAHAGFTIDPSLQVALENPGSQSSPGAAVQSGLSSVHPTPASPTVGAAIPTASVKSASIPAPSDAWNKKLQGFAHKEPLRQALSHTIPPGGQLVVNGDLPDARVSWDGASADSRMTVARKMLVDAGIDGRFEGDNLIVGSPAPATVTGNPPTATAPTKQASVAVSPAVPVVPAAPAVPTQEIWIIRQGYPIGQELKGWAKRAGWNVVWGLQRDVIAPTTTTFTGDFASAASEVVRTLAENGALIHAQIFDGNHTLVVQGPGVAQQ
jgi:hypothetical protein